MGSTTSSSTKSTLGSATPIAYLDHYLKLFLTRLKPTMRAGRGGIWYAADRKLTRREFSLAITGQKSLGLYAVSRQGNSLWTCLDVDDAESFKGLAALAFTLSDQDNILLERSRRGGHLWIFGPPTPWQQAQDYGRYLAASYGLKKVEVFPKGPGLSGVKAPASRHPRTGLCYPFLDPKTGEVLDDFQATILKLRQRPFPVVHYREEPHLFGNSEQVSPRPVKGMETDHLALCMEIERYTRLRHYAPTKAKGRCVFHDDRHPSLSVIDGYWRCWACGVGGGLSAFRKLAREKGL